MGMSAAHCQGNVMEFQSVWRVVAVTITTIWVKNTASNCRPYYVCSTSINLQKIFTVLLHGKCAIKLSLKLPAPDLNQTDRPSVSNTDTTKASVPCVSESQSKKSNK